MLRARLLSASSGGSTDDAMALADVDRVIAINGANAAAVELRAAVHERRGDWRKASVDYSWCIDIDSAKPDLYVGLARSRMRSGETVLALSDIDKGQRK